MGRRPHLPAASSGKPAHPLHLSLCHEPAVKKSKGNKNAIKKEKNRGLQQQKALEHFCIFVTFTFGQYLHFHTFRTGGFVIKSSNGSSGLTVVKFSCKIPIFFSLSHPDGLKEKEKIFKLLFKKI